MKLNNKKIEVLEIMKIKEKKYNIKMKEKIKL